ncbi:hypothetical protein PFISCL1PPCAC_6490 [Pristionchus fissidentatus]|uniref:HORMA domain-containing protein n=1 Tax=Pristionchus fissidentatus TaxID=1538716 RepID=A0AAV5VAE9_9BILA|nr:hypothetical protein PFISCL1PPCAC_6490 [Pristionchus fissidentatus]
MRETREERFAQCSPLTQMMLIVFSRILQKRKYYDDGYFFELEVNGASVFLIDWTNPFVLKSIPNSIIGAGAAADLQYIEMIQLVFKLENDIPDRFVERFGICFDENNDVELVSPTRRVPLSPPSASWTSNAVIEMSRAVDEMCAELDVLPRATERMGGLRAFFRVDYNRNRPKGYQAPHFERSSFPTLHYSDLLQEKQPQFPAPQRSISSSRKMRSTLSVESLLSRSNSVPAGKAAVAAAPTARPTTAARQLFVTQTDSTIASPFRTASSLDVRETVLPPVKGGHGDDVSDEDEEEDGEKEKSDGNLSDDEREEKESDDDVTDEEKELKTLEEEMEEVEDESDGLIETTRGDEEERRDRKRPSIGNGDDGLDMKKTRSSSSTSLLLSNRDGKRASESTEQSILSTSLEVGFNSPTDRSSNRMSVDSAKKVNASTDQSILSTSLEVGVDSTNDRTGKLSMDSIKTATCPPAKEKEGDEDDGYRVFDDDEDKGGNPNESLESDVSDSLFIN